MARRIFELILTAVCFTFYNLNMGFVIYDIVTSSVSYITFISLAGAILLAICCIINTIEIIKDRL